MTRKGMIAQFIILFGIASMVAMAVLIATAPSVYYPIYKATLPFGIIEVSGGFILGTGHISGEETYYIKYWKGQELLSLSIAAEHCPIIIDGTFRLEQASGGAVQSFKIHIPKLPEANQTWSTEWIR